MSKTTLKNAMDHVNISQDMQENIIKNVNRQMKGQKHHMKHWKRTVSIAAAALLAVGILSIPVQAGIRYLVKARMESIPKEELDEITEIMKTQDSLKAQAADPEAYPDADTFSRDYSPEEKERMAELYKAYQQGSFPDGKLPTVAAEADAVSGDFCYAEDTGRFLFPQREMTDEELLEIIDFNYKRDYALSQSEDVKAAQAAWEEQQRRQIQLIREGGGISEGEALAAARDLLSSLFGISPEGMEENCYLDEDHQTVPAYCVTLSVRSNCYYYFWISAADKSLVNVHVSQAAWLDLENLPADQITDRIPAALKAAESFLENQMNIHETYKEIHCLYKVIDGKIAGNRAGFYFIREDKSAHWVTFFCGAEENSSESFQLSEYRRSNYDEYLEKLKSATENAEIIDIPMTD